MIFDLNLLSVFLAATAAMVVGMAWYSPLLFAKPWMRLSGMAIGEIPDAKKKGMVKTYAPAFVNCLLMASGLGYLLNLSGVVEIREAMILVAVAWLAFVAPVLLSSVLWERKPFALYLINVGYYLVSFLLMGAILTVLV